MTESKRQESKPTLEELVADTAAFANSMVEAWAELGRRYVRQDAANPDFSGPLQEFWMTSASAAGDLAELSYKWVQAVDGLGGFSSSPSTEGRATQRSRTKAANGDRTRKPK